MPEETIRGMLDEYAAAARAKDVNAFAALYADDVQVFDMWGSWAYRGLRPWRAMAEQWFGSLGDEQVAVTFDETEVRVAGELAFLHTFVRYAGLAADGTELRALQNRMTWVLRRGQDGVWYVVHEHSSSPADFETGKVVLTR